MSLIDHSDVIKFCCSFFFLVNFKCFCYRWCRTLYLLFVSHGNKAAYSDGFVEGAIGSILRETLEDLDYLLKLSNIALHSNGEVKFFDIMISAFMFYIENGSDLVLVHFGSKLLNLFFNCYDGYEERSWEEVGFKYVFVL
ncbi:unnamed protein product [Vicia faba]|uniref:Uncharacterized protein n=1 Tax=Vicia faba TaxID=3906 RepID=A0AAV1ADF8_VICFA|nr:unnamed protein product [Vicia faba]